MHMPRVPRMGGGRQRWSTLAQSVGAAVAAYVVAGTIELDLIRIFQPTERELAWVSDVLLAAALGVAVYLWRHLSATRLELAGRERAELIIDTQLAVAADMQRRLLPPLPSSEHGVAWAASLRPAGRIGGDFYDVMPLGPGRWMLLVADVSGKGTPAAMALATLRAGFRALARGPNSPATVLSRLSAMLHEQWGGMPYVTAIVARLDRDAGELTYSNAGHPAGVVTGPRGVRLLEALGPPAALLPELAYDERTLVVEPGDICLLVTDGVTEALSESCPAALERLARATFETSRSVGTVCDAVMAEALRGIGPKGVIDWQDDRTVLVLAVEHDGPVGRVRGLRACAASAP